jgi:hypothetical protein
LRIKYSLQLRAFAAWHFSDIIFLVTAMNRVIQMVKTLHAAAQPTPIAGFHLRSLNDPTDLAAWLALRQTTFAREKLGVRAWDETDFRHEFSTKPWWNPQHCWVIETVTTPPLHKLPGGSSAGSAGNGGNGGNGDGGNGDGGNGNSQLTGNKGDGNKGDSQLVGSVTLAMRSGAEADRAVVHWLMVHPRYRTQGLGRWLLACLELAAWNLGHRAVYLETHSAWEAASRFYLAAGYLPTLAEGAK